MILVCKKKPVNYSNPSSDDNQLNNLTLEEEFTDWCQGVPYVTTFHSPATHVPSFQDMVLYYSKEKRSGTAISSKYFCMG